MSKPTGKPRGRPKGAASKMNEEARRKAAQTGITPLEYMLAVMHMEGAQKVTEVVGTGRKKKTITTYVDKWGDPVTAARRDAMCIAAAPFVHARLSAITHKGDQANPIRHIHEAMSPQEAAQAYAEAIRGTGASMPIPRPPMRLVNGSGE